MADILNRGDVVDAVAAEVDLPQSKVDAVLKSFESTLARQLAAGGEIRMPGFGSFKTTERAARTSRNPRTGEPIPVPARTALRFVPGKGLKEAAASVKVAGSSSKTADTKAPAKAASTKAASAKAAEKAPKSADKAPKGAAKASADKVPSKSKKK